MGAVEDYFNANGWPKNNEDAKLAKAVVEAAEEAKRNAEKCKRLSTHLQQVRLLLAAGRYDAAVVKLKQGMEQA